jgi:hypothetical protein
MLKRLGIRNELVKYFFFAFNGLEPQATVNKMEAQRGFVHDGA